ncbi:MAG TPA: beta-ketoacyl-ACP synthase III [Herpetosiphonaceae bacterium]|nr:beta-ketoacyl-ACP synthase III [Herpetosiphonaceae bacterium]
MAYAAITGWGMCVPERILTNAELERMVDTSDEWIQTRTGIRERRVVGPGETSSTLGSAAARQALERAGVRPEQIDLIVVGTSTPDNPLPSTASIVQTKLGATRAAPFDVNAACSGFVYALVTGTQFIRAGGMETVLVVGADVLTRYINYQDRNTCILFGDGAGAVVLQASQRPAGVLAFDLGAVVGTSDLLYVSPSASHPLVADALPPEGQYMRMEGREVFKYAVRAMGDSSLKVLQETGLTVGDIDLLVPHQANLRMIEAVAKRLDLPMERAVVNIDRYGNTSAGTIPLAMCEAWDAGRLQDGQNVLITACGGGLTWGSAVIKWGRG